MQVKKHGNHSKPLDYVSRLDDDANNIRRDVLLSSGGGGGLDEETGAGLLNFETPELGFSRGN